MDRDPHLGTILAAIACAMLLLLLVWAFVSAGCA